jgi:hypothetical protein
MLLQFENYLTLENIYLWTNLGILPFWAMLIIIPNSRITQFFVNSIIIPLILSAAYIYIFYNSILVDESLSEIFKLYLGLDNLYTLFTSSSFLLIFWIHFVAINLFLGSWVSSDAFRNGISKKIVFLPLLLIYFAGPVGLFLYWIIRIFYAKKLGFHD